MLGCIEDAMYMGQQTPCAKDFSYKGVDRDLRYAHIHKPKNNQRTDKIVKNTKAVAPGDYEVQKAFDKT